MRSRTLAAGMKYMTNSRPNPAHSVVPVVLGSTKRFWVSSCITRPDIAMAAPASTRATVRGMRVMANIRHPSSPLRMTNAGLDWSTNRSYSKRKLGVATTVLRQMSTRSGNSSEPRDRRILIGCTSIVP